MLVASYVLKGVGALLVLLPLAVDQMPEEMRLALFGLAVPIGYGAVVLAARGRNDGGP